MGTAQGNGWNKRLAGKVFWRYRCVDTAADNVNCTRKVMSAVNTLCSAVSCWIQPVPVRGSSDLSRLLLGLWCAGLLGLS